MSLFSIFLSFLAGIMYILMLVFYFKAAKIEEISRVVPFFYLSPLFVLIFAGLFLNENFTTITYLGIFLLIVGTFIISSKDLTRVSLGKAFWFMLFASITWAVSLVITKYLLNFADFWTIFSYTRIGTIFGLIPIFYFNFSELIKTVKRHGKKVVGIISLNEFLNLLGILFITIASSIGYVALVDTLSSTAAFFVLVLAVILSIFYPKILKEEIGKSTILQKLIAIILMFIGAMLIT